MSAFIVKDNKRVYAEEYTSVSTRQSTIYLVNMTNEHISLLQFDQYVGFPNRGAAAEQNV